MKEIKARKDIGNKHYLALLKQLKISGLPDRAKVLIYKINHKT